LLGINFGIVYQLSGPGLSVVCGYHQIRDSATISCVTKPKSWKWRQAQRQASRLPISEIPWFCKVAWHRLDHERASIHCQSTSEHYAGPRFCCLLTVLDIKIIQSLDTHYIVQHCQHCGDIEPTIIRMTGVSGLVGRHSLPVYFLPDVPISEVARGTQTSPNPIPGQPCATMDKLGRSKVNKCSTCISVKPHWFGASHLAKLFDFRLSQNEQPIWTSKPPGRCRIVDQT
jgi:hypothetical protein